MGWFSSESKEELTEMIQTLEVELIKLERLRDKLYQDNFMSDTDMRIGEVTNGIGGRIVFYNEEELDYEITSVIRKIEKKKRKLQKL